MSDDNRDIDVDIESNDENDSDTRTQNRSSSNGIQTQFFSQTEKRAHHNALERKRRDQIKDSFTSLKESVPSLQGEKGASRAQILKEAANFIQVMARKSFSHKQDVNDLERQNRILEQQIKQLEKQQADSSNGQFYENMKSNTSSSTSSDELTDGEDSIDQQSKKFKPTSYTDADDDALVNDAPVNRCDDLEAITLSIDDILSHIQGIDTCKDDGPENISPLLLNNCAQNLSAPLHQIFNLSLFIAPPEH